MSRLLTILAVQARPAPFDPEATLDKLEREMAEAVKSFPATDLMVFPELYLMAEDPFTGLEPPGYASRVAEPVPGPITDRVAKVAASSKRWIVAGSLLERADGTIYNTAVVFSPQGELAATHRKLFPWRPWERVSPGDASTVFEIPSVGRLGLAICYEAWFPETARALALAGAEVIVQPALTTTPDREEELVMARAAAIANQCYVVNVNAASTIGGGRSAAFDPEGRVLFEAGPGEERILEVLDLERVATVRRRGTRGLNPVLRHFQEAPPSVFELYRRLLDGR